MAVYESGLAAMQGEQMYDLYMAFLTEQLDKLAPAAGDSRITLPKLKGRSKQLAKALLEVRTALGCCCHHTNLLLYQVSLMLLS